MDRRDWRIVVRHLSGEATPEEHERVRTWSAEHPDNAAELDRLRQLWETVGTLPAADVDTAGVWRRVAGRTVLLDEHPRTAGRHGRVASAAWRPALLRIAAMLALVMGAGLLWGPGSGLVRDHVVNRTVTTGKGERLEVELADGTRVLLGVDSRLRYPRRFRGSARDVHLQGAGYFDVARDEARPFSVYTSGSVTRVLGTRFTVRDYGSADEPARVAVTEGRVAVRARRAADESTDVILTQGESAELTAGGAVARVHDAVHAVDLAWTRGTIALRNASVQAVLAEIGRWYDVDIRVEDASLAARHLTISFDDEPLDAILQEVSAVLDARIETRGSTLILTPAAAAKPDEAQRSE